MTTDFQHQISYRTALSGELSLRRARNPRYSLSSFARDLKMSAAGLSDVMSGKQGLSLDKARDVCAVLAMDPEEAAFFCDSVVAEHARGAADREQARERLAAFEYRNPITEAELTMFRRITRWCPVYKSVRFIAKLITHLEVTGATSA